MYLWVKWRAERNVRANRSTLQFEMRLTTASCSRTSGQSAVSFSPCSASNTPPSCSELLSDVMAELQNVHITWLFDNQNHCRLIFYQSTGWVSDLHTFSVSSEITRCHPNDSGEMIPVFNCFCARGLILNRPDSSEDQWMFCCCHLWSCSPPG